MEQQIGSKLGKGYDKAVYCHPVYLTYMHSTPCKMTGWMNPKLESRLWEKYQQPQICRWYHSNGIRSGGSKEPLNEDKKVEWKSCPEAQHSKN